jgi:hypothetical protein
MKINHLILAGALLAATQQARAQNPMLYFTDKGAVRGNMPEKLLTSDILQFRVDGKDLLPDEQKSLSDKAAKAVARIDHLSSEQLNILDWVYDIKPPDLAIIRAQFQTIIADQAHAAQAYVPGIEDNSTYYHVTTQDIAGMPHADMQANDPTSFLLPSALQYPNQNAVTLALNRTNLFKKTTFGWYTTFAGDYSKELSQADIDALNGLKTQSKNVLSDFQAIVAKVKNNLIKNGHELKLFDAQLDKILALLTTVQARVDFSDDKEWILDWFWYGTSKIPELNPFSFQKGEDIALPDTSGLPALRATVFTEESYLKNLNVNKVPEAVAKKYIKEIAANRLTIAATLKAFQTATDQQNDNDKQIADFAATVTALNKVLLIVSNSGADDPIYWMRHHDALDNGAEMNFKEQLGYTEEDRVFILTHNLTANQQANVALKYTPIGNDESPFAETVTSVLQSLGPLVANTAGTRDELSLADYTLLAASVNRKIFQVQNQLSCLLAIDYLLAQSNPKLDVKELTDPVELYHSQKDRTPGINGPQQAVYTVSIGAKAADAGSSAAGSSNSAAAAAPAAVSGIPVDTFKYRVNKLYRVFPMAGIAYTFNHFGSVATNSSSAAPGVLTTETQTHFFVGLKVFLQKTDIRNTSFISGTDAHGNPLFWTRVHLDAGFDLSKPLNNIYTGAGIDPFPGVGLNFGLVWNKYDYYRYAGDNQNLHQSLYRPGIYLGLSTDVALIAQLTKLLNLSK